MFTSKKDILLSTLLQFCQPCYFKNDIQLSTTTTVYFIACPEKLSDHKFANKAELT